MTNFKYFDDGEAFSQPEKPFLLIYANERDNELRVAWLETKDDLTETAEDLKLYGYKIVGAIEIGSCRDVNIEEV